MTLLVKVSLGCGKCCFAQFILLSVCIVYVIYFSVVQGVVKELALRLILPVAANRQLRRAVHRFFSHFLLVDVIKRCPVYLIFKNLGQKFQTIAFLCAILIQRGKILQNLTAKNGNIAQKSVHLNLFYSDHILPGNGGKAPMNSSVQLPVATTGSYQLHDSSLNMHRAVH